jgi:hypothetical protein
MSSISHWLAKKYPPPPSWPILIVPRESKLPLAKSMALTSTSVGICPSRKTFIVSLTGSMTNTR